MLSRPIVVVGERKLRCHPYQRRPTSPKRCQSGRESRAFCRYPRQPTSSRTQVAEYQEAGTEAIEVRRNVFRIGQADDREYEGWDGHREARSGGGSPDERHRTPLSAKPDREHGGAHERTGSLKHRLYHRQAQDGLQGRVPVEEGMSERIGQSGRGDEKQHHPAPRNRRTGRGGRHENVTIGWEGLQSQRHEADEYAAAPGRVDAEDVAGHAHEEAHRGQRR